jgi:hypothetical protein
MISKASLSYLFMLCQLGKTSSSHAVHVFFVKVNFTKAKARKDMFPKGGKF